MCHRFKGLEKFGLESLTDLQIYDDNKDKNKNNYGRKGGTLGDMFCEEDALFDKTYNCPCCGSEFKTKAVRAGRTKLDRLDHDLRPVYLYVDATKYDAVVCPRCGYASLIKTFHSVSDKQAGMIKEKISSKFQGISNDKPLYTYDDAIERAQLALLSTVVKGAKNSEKAYACLKIAWLLRGKKESLDKEDENYEEKLSELQESEFHYLKNVYEGFSNAYLNEAFPIAGMDEPTFCIVIAETARKLGHKGEALKYLANVLVSKTASERMKDMARDIKKECMTESE